MTERRQSKKINHSILTGSKLFSLRHLIRPFSFAVSKPDFFKWLTQKYGIFRNWRIRFPALLFPLRNLVAFVRNLSLKRICIFAPERNHYHNQNPFFNINSSPRISLIAERSRALHNETVQMTSPHRGPEGRYPVFTPAEGRAGEQKPGLTLESQRILSKMTKMLITVKPDNQLTSISKIDRSPLKSPDVSDEIHHSGVTKHFGEAKYQRNKYEASPERRPTITSPETKFAPFHQLIHVHSDKELGTDGSEKVETWHSASYDSVSSLHYYDPLKVALDDLRESVASMERKGVEDEVVLGRSKPPESSAAEKTSDVTQRTNINIDHLTNQVYQMLEKKLRIERERRGL